MKILFFRETELKELNPFVLEKQGLAATESCIICLAQELSKRHTVKVIAPQSRQQLFGKVKYIPFQSYAEVLIHVSIFKPDVLIVAGNPQILIEHSFNCKTIFWQQNHPKEMDFRFPIKKILLKSLIVAPSPEAANYYNRHYETNNIIGIYNGVRNEFFNKSHLPTINKIVYIGAFSVTKGLSVFLQSALELPQYDFHYCGDFNLYGFIDKAYKIYCESITQKCTNLTFHSSLNAEQLAKVLQTATLCVVNPLPNNYETCCVSALEAIVMGVPVIGGESEILSNIIKHAGLKGMTTTNLTQTIENFNLRNVYANQELKNYKNIEFIKKLNWVSIAQEWEKILDIVIKDIK
jgi:glycosyltransferase involved in cell wall biosynthesis